MSWTTLTPFLPYLRGALLALAAYYTCLAFLSVRNARLTMPLRQALRTHRRKVVLSVILVLAVIFFGNSSAYRPKDRIQADYRERDSRLEEIDSRSPSPDLGTVGTATTDWETVRSQYRERIREEEEQFERATSE